MMTGTYGCVAVMVAASLVTGPLVQRPAIARWETTPAVSEQRTESAPIHSVAPIHLQGTVAIVEANHLTLVVGRQWHRLPVSERAVILVNRIESSLPDVQPGQFASITANQVKNQALVTFINAHHQY